MTNNTIEILSSINRTVSTIATYVAPKNGTGKETTATLSKGSISTESASASAPNAKIGLSSIKDFIGVISGLPVPIKAVAKLSGRTIKNFSKVMDKICDVLVNLDERGKKIDSKRINKVLEPINDILIINTSFARMTLIAPFALVGVLMTYPVILTYVGIIKMVGAFHGLGKGVRKINRMTRSMRHIMAFVWSATLLVGACILLGTIIAKGGDKVLVFGLAVLGMTLFSIIAIMGIIGIARGIMSSMGVMKGVREIIVLTLAAFAIVALCIAVGATLANNEAMKILGNGLLVLGLTLLTLGGMLFLVGILGKVIDGSGADKGLRTILVLTIASMLLIVAARFLAVFINKNYEAIQTGLNYTFGVMLAIVTFGIIAGKMANKARKGIYALGVIELLAFGAMGLVLAANSLAETIKGREKEVTNALLAVGGVILAFGGLAALFGAPIVAGLSLADLCIIGSVGLGASLLLARGAVELIRSIIDLDLYKNELGVGWQDVANDVIAIGGVVAGFGILAAAFLPLSPVILLATPAMALTIGFSNKILDVINSLITVKKRADELAVGDKSGMRVLKDFVSDDVPGILKSFRMDKFDVPLNLIQMEKLNIKYAALARLSKNLVESMSVVSKVAGIGQMIRGGKIYSIKKFDPKTGEITYSDNAVDLNEVSTVICGSLGIFVNNMNYGLRDLAKMVIGAKMFEILGTITSPISTFLEMVTGYTGGKNKKTGSYELQSVRIGEDGKIKYGAKVNVQDVSENIAEAVTIFIKNIFSDDNVKSWYDMVYGNQTWWQKTWGLSGQKAKAAKEMGGILGMFISPISQFIECISKFEASGNTLTPITFDSEGNPKAGKPVNVAAISKLIGKGISTFLTEVMSVPFEKYDEDNVEMLDALLAKTGDVSKVFSDLSANTIIDTNRLDEIYTSFNKGADSIIKVNGALVKFNNIVNAENRRRKKNLKELGESIEEFLSKFKDENGTISNLYNLILRLQYMDTDKISKNMGAVKLGGGMTLNEGAKLNEANGRFVTGREIPKAPPLTKEDVVSAIKEALDNMQLDGGIISPESVPDQNTRALMNAIQKMNFQINTV